MPEDARKSLGDRLRNAREYLGLSQEEVAQQMGLPRPAISQIENGNRKVDAIELTKFAKIYQRPASFFTGEEVEGPTTQLEILKRAASELSEQDQNEVLQFAQFLRSRATTNGSK